MCWLCLWCGSSACWRAWSLASMLSLSRAATSTCNPTSRLTISKFPPIAAYIRVVTPASSTAWTSHPRPINRFTSSRFPPSAAHIRTDVFSQSVWWTSAPWTISLSARSKSPAEAAVISGDGRQFTGGIPRRRALLVRLFFPAAVPPRSWTLTRSPIAG